MKKIAKTKDKSTEVKSKKNTVKNPTVANPKLKAKKIKQKLFISTFIKNKCMIASTCEDMGITLKCYYEWLGDEEFADAINESIEKMQDRIEKVLYDKIEKEKDTTALIFYLKTKGKKRGYVEKQQLDVNASVNVQILQNDPIEDSSEK